MAQLNFGGVIENVMTRVYKVPVRLATCATMVST